MTAVAPVIVKLGGSLAASSTLAELLRVLGSAAVAGLPVVIVPGGGPFADTVRDSQRHLDVDDDAAHDMALLAMAQYGRLLAGLAPEFTHPVWGAEAAAAVLGRQARAAIVWLPQPQCDAIEVERSWRIGADALALWLASYLGATEVILVKSCDRPTEQSLPALAASGVMDSAYPELAARQPNIATTLVYAASAAALNDALAAVRRARTRVIASPSSVPVRSP